MQCPDPPVDEMPDTIDDHYIREAIINPCGSLLEVRNSSHGTNEGLRTIHLKHFSVRQYFLSNTSGQGESITANARLWAWNTTIDNTRLSILCIHYINYQTVWKEESSVKSSAVMTTFRDYAASFWHQHAVLSAPLDNTLMAKMEAFFDKKNPNWKHWAGWFDSNIHEQKAETRVERPVCPLHHAVRLGFAKLVQGLAGRDIADIDQRDHFGKTPLYIGCEAGRIEIVQELLCKGADLTAPDKDGWTPLNSASFNGHIEVVKLLLEKGADLAVPDKDGETPLITRWAGHNKQQAL
jgi:hypothetical protein